MSHVIRGERVRLRRWNDADLAPCATLNDDPEVMQHMHKSLPRDEIGWRLARAAWGHGYATEGAALALRHGLEVAKLPQVVSIAALDNHASIAVMARIGLTRRGEFDHPTLPAAHRSHRHVLYSKERAKECP